MEKLVAESLEELGITEKLKGKQYKIDADKNKKITGNDFKILRGEKKPPKRVNEAVKTNTPFIEFLLKSARENELPRKVINFIKQSASITAPVDKFLLDHPDFNIEEDFYGGGDVIFDNLFDKWGDNLEAITLKDIQEELSIIVGALLEELPESLPQTSDSQISVEEVEKWVDSLIKADYQDIEELKEVIHRFFDQHPYMHEELGELKGKDKYAKPINKLFKYYQGKF